MHYLRYVIAVVGTAAIGSAIFYTLEKQRRAKQNQSENKSSGFNDDKDKLGVIFNSIEEGVVLIDNKGAIKLFNPAASTLTGWGVEDALGIDVKTVIKLVDNKGKLFSDEANPFISVFSQGQTIRANNALVLSKSNKSISVSIIISPLVTGTEVTSAVALIRNVTEEKLEEDRLVDFISTASHEMRTPVAAIQGYLELVLNNKVTVIDDKARDYLEKAHESTKHLGQLFQDLLLSAKAEDGRLASNPVVFEIGAFLRKLTEDLRLVASKKQLETEFVFGSVAQATKNTGGEKQIEPLFFVYADPDRLLEVINNLFDNAVKYTPSGKIIIGLTGDNQVVQFYIQDTGTGIDSEDIPHLFQKFYRVDNSTTRTVGGTGLGLFICKKIVELYNGRIWIESEVNKGSTFYINLPRLSSQKAEELSSQAKNGTIIPPTISTATTS